MTLLTAAALYSATGHAEVLSALDDLKHTRRRLSRLGWLVQICRRAASDDDGSDPTDGTVYKKSHRRIGSTGLEKRRTLGGGALLAAAAAVAEPVRYTLEEARAALETQTEHLTCGLQMRIHAACLRPMSSHLPIAFTVDALVRFTPQLRTSHMPTNPWRMLPNPWRMLPTDERPHARAAGAYSS